MGVRGLHDIRRGLVRGRLRDGILPPTIGYQEQDEECDLNYIPNQAQKVPVTYALSTNLGFGGHNACLAFKKTEQEEQA